MAIRRSTARRARASERASMASASAKSTITIAASGHWPITTAPVTAMAISALMFSVRWRSAPQPLRYVDRPVRPMAISASASAGHAVSPAENATASAPRAAAPPASRRAGLGWVSMPVLAPLRRPPSQACAR
jgi:hypothetical protein